MDKKQETELTLFKLPHGGYTVTIGRRQEGYYPTLAFAGTLGECLEYMRDAVTFDDRQKSHPIPPTPETENG